MNMWSDWRRRMKRAEGWDGPSRGDPSRGDPIRGDPEIASLKGVFHSAAREDLEIGERIWRNLRPCLHALEDFPLSPASLWGALAAAGPRFALGAACACLIAAGAFLSLPARPDGLDLPARSARTARSAHTARSGDVPRAQVAALAPPPAIAEAPATPEEYPVQALQASSGDDLLQFIAYGAPPR